MVRLLWSVLIALQMPIISTLAGFKFQAGHPGSLYLYLATLILFWLAVTWPHKFIGEMQ